MPTLLRLVYQSLFLLYIPVLIGMFFFKGKYRKSLLYKLGLKKQPICCQENVIWIHGVSLGEITACYEFSKIIKEQGYNIICSTLTETGFDKALKNPYFDKVVYLPIDFYFSIKALIKNITPKGLICIEGDLWPEFLLQMKKKNVKVIIANGKLSDTSFKRYLGFPFLRKHLFSLIDLMLVQDENYYHKFLSLGISSASLKITGNMKLDMNLERLSDDRLKALKQEINTTYPIALLASTHQDEEMILINALAPILNRIKILVVPRHAHRSDEILFQIRSLGITSDKLSKRSEKARVTIVDEMGSLNMYYQICDFAIVGGSFVPVGGHNIFEPIFFEKPTLFGPFMDKQREFKKIALTHKFAKEVDAQDLLKTVEAILSNQQSFSSSKVKNFLLNSRGSSMKNWSEIKKYLNI